MIIHLNWNSLCRAHAVPPQRGPGCDAFFPDARTHQATLSTTGVTESWRGGEVEGGGPTRHAVLALT